MGQGCRNMSGPMLVEQTRSGLASLKPAPPVQPGRSGGCRLGLAPAEGCRDAAGGRTRSPGKAKAKWTLELPLTPAPQRQNPSSPCRSRVSSWAGRGPLSRLQALPRPAEGRIPSR